MLSATFTNSSPVCTVLDPPAEQSVAKMTSETGRSPVSSRLNKDTNNLNFSAKAIYYMCSVNSLIIRNSYTQSGNLLICRNKAVLSVLMLFVNHKLFSVFLHLDYYTCDFYLTQLNIPSALFFVCFEGSCLASSCHLHTTQLSSALFQFSC